MSEMLDIMAKAMRELSLTTDRCPAPETYSLLHAYPVITHRS